MRRPCRPNDWHQPVLQEEEKDEKEEEEKEEREEEEEVEEEEWEEPLTRKCADTFGVLAKFIQTQ